MTQLKKLEIHSRHLDAPVTVDIPQDPFFSENSPLLKFDSNQDGTIVYSPDRGVPSDTIEISGANNAHFDFNSAERFARQFQRFSALQEMQEPVFSQAVLPLIQTPATPEEWETAKRILSLTGDYRHLFDLALTVAQEGNDAVAEDFLFTAYRLAGRNKAGREMIPRIEEKLNEVGARLEQNRQARFEMLTQYPYLLSGATTPVTAGVPASDVCDPDNPPEVRASFSVAVPPDFIADNADDPEGGILDFFLFDQRVAVRPIGSNDGEPAGPVELLPLSAIPDSSSPDDDPWSAPFVYHIDPERANRRLFGRPMEYYTVTFAVPSAEILLGGHSTRRCDLVFLEGDETVREEKGTFVLSAEGEEETTVSVAGDLHVSLDDWKNVKDIIDGMTESAKKGEPVDPRAAEAVERFYASANEKVMEYLEESQNQRYREEISRIFLLGDLTDYANRAVTLESEGYYLSNVRLFAWMIENNEAPIYAVYGNHDWHGPRFPPGYHLFNFQLKPELNEFFSAVSQKYFLLHGRPIEWVDALNSLSPFTADGIYEFPAAVVSKFLSGGPDNIMDVQMAVGGHQFINDYLRESGPYEAYGLNLGNGARAVFLPSGPEEWDPGYILKTFGRFLAEGAAKEYRTGRHDYVGAIASAARQTDLNGQGPGGHSLVSLVAELEHARSQGKHVVVFTHFPAFNLAVGRGKEAEETHRLEDKSARALRMISKHYRFPSGEPVMSAMVSGHVHTRSVGDFRFEFSSEAEQGAYETALEKILAEKNPDTLLDELNTLWEKSGLENKIVVTRQEKEDPYRIDNKTAFVTIDGVGRSLEGDETGFALMHFGADGSINLDFKNLYVNPEGEVVVYDDAEEYRAQRLAETEAWDREQFAQIAADKEEALVLVSSPVQIPDDIFLVRR
ncbi:MAG: metallophosphoesterase [Deltaproteobacteria bacterium]|nr:metallophosphoesterase [Deltaproteobacteria bacterium]